MTGGNHKIKISAIFVVGFFIFAFWQISAAQALNVVDSAITTPTTWTKASSPYIIWSNIVVVDSLTIEPGVVIKLSGVNAGMFVANAGNIKAQGTADEPIIFTSYYDDTAGGSQSAGTPKPGDWKYLFFGGGPSVLEHVQIRYAGNNRYRPEPEGMLDVRSNLTMRDSVVSKSNVKGIYLAESSTATFERIIVENNNNVGISANASLNSSILRDSIIRNNGREPLTMPANTSLSIINTTFTDNAIQAVKVSSRDIISDVNWSGLNIPYLFSGEIKVKPGATLTIEPGAIIKSGKNTRFRVQGNLKARGTPDLPIVFTSIENNPSYGDWGGIFFDSSPDSILENVEVKYGGKFYGNFNGVYYLTVDTNLIHASNSSLSVASSTISYADDVAVLLEGNTSFVLDNSAISNNKKGILSGASQEWRMRGNRLFSNSVYALSVTRGQVDAKDNWWGDDSGPVHADNPGGGGDKVIGNVLFDPWTGKALPNQPPVLSFVAGDGYIDDGVEPNNAVMPVFQVNYSDEDNDPPAFVRVVINDSAYDMQAVADRVFAFTLAQNTLPPGHYSYHFETSDNTAMARFPASKELSFAITPDPVILIPGILGSWNLLGKWELDPILHTYDDLWSAFEQAGFTQGRDLFALPYNWRLANLYTAGLLKEKINSIKQICSCNKVDIVAHSMGGLVARAYIELLDYGDDVDQLIFLGTPHKGATDAYLTWEGGDLGVGLGSAVFKRIFVLEASFNGYGGVFEYMRGLPMESVKELLPIYDYLRDKETGALRSYPNNYPQNSFLELLNNSRQLDKLNSVRAINLIADNNSNNTIDNLRVEDKKFNFGEWEHGYPDGFNKIFRDKGVEYGPGDGTVPKRSNENFARAQNVVIKSSHTGMVADVQKTVIKTLTGIEPAEDVKKNIFSKFLLIRIFSPADFKVIAPDGRQVGKDFTNNTVINEIDGAFYSGFAGDMEFAVIPDPLAGDYKVELQGTGSGEYVLATDYITETSEIGTESKGQIESEKEIDYQININKQTTNSLSVAPGDSEPPRTSIALSGKEMDNDVYQESVNITLAPADNGSGVFKTEYSLDKGATWLEYSNSVILNETGDYYFYYRSLDNVGNTEPTKIRSFTIKAKPFSGGVPIYLLQPVPEAAQNKQSTNINSGAESSLPGARVLGEKIENKSKVLNKDYFADIKIVLSSLGLTRDLSKEKGVMAGHTRAIISGVLSWQAEDLFALTNFTVYGTPETRELGLGERAGVLYSYKNAFAKIPKTSTEWNDIIRIAGGQAPLERNRQAEKEAEKILRDIYSKLPDKNKDDNQTALFMISYGLRAGRRDLAAEVEGIAAFASLYNHLPVSAYDWDVIRSIAY